MSASSDLVVVTGASGFIATHCIQQLLEKGYRVRGTLRSESRQEEVRKGVAPTDEMASRLEFAMLNLLSDDGWDEAMQGARYLLHIASPVPRQPPKDPAELIEPARAGALRALRAASAAGIERTVMTSSIAAIAAGHKRSADSLFDENDWSDLSGKMGAYERSKTVAEKAAWDFMEDVKAEGSVMELVTINPGMVLGPSLIADSSASSEVVGKLLRREVPGCPDLSLALVDVRDVAAAHVAAMTAEGVAGQRFIVTRLGMPMPEMARVLAELVKDRGFKIPTRQLPNFLVRLVAVFDKTVRLIVHELGMPMNLSSKRAEEALGFRARDLDAMLRDTVDSLIEHGLV
jgi:nucleoside-diphosphate-sugar epimerase